MWLARPLRAVRWIAGLSLACAACGAGHARAVRHMAAAYVAVTHVAVTRPEPVRPVLFTSSAGQPLEPSGFSRGACLAFSPTAPARHQTVFLDAGHGGRDPGAVGSTQSGRTIYEAGETLAVELDTLALLRAAGFRVVVSRTRDSSVLRLGRMATFSRSPHLDSCWAGRSTAA